jgi:hypothetical protein
MSLSGLWLYKYRECLGAFENAEMDGSLAIPPTVERFKSLLTQEIK